MSPDSDLTAAGITDPRLRADYLHCRELAREHGRTYFLATRFLPAERRPAIHALYGFARTADDIVDDVTPGVTVESKRVGLQHLIDEFHDPDGAREPSVRAALDTARRLVLRPPPPLSGRIGERCPAPPHRPRAVRSWTWCRSRCCRPTRFDSTVTAGVASWKSVVAVLANPYRRACVRRAADKEAPAVLTGQLATMQVISRNRGSVIQHRGSALRASRRPPLMTVPRPRRQVPLPASPRIRSAASRPEISTIGTPTPGWVPGPGEHDVLAPAGCAGRNGPVWPNECAAANGVPRSMPRAAQSSGVVTCSTSMPSPKPT